MRKVICNPLNIEYRYQFNVDPRTQIRSVNREAADPSLILFQDRYYIFASMTLGVWVSDDLAQWSYHSLPEDLPLYDYAPDVRVIGDYVYFSASKRDEVCNFFRTKNILEGPYEKIDGSFPFWDPNLFQDDDGKVYFYWGCSSETPIYGIELDAETFKPVGERTELIHGNPWTRGYERTGEDHCLVPRMEAEIDEAVKGFFAAQGIDAATVPDEVLPMVRGMFSQKPFIEGAWMTKHRGKYYLQYACPGTEYNTYADGVYISDHPLGPFQPAKNNPYSYHPGGFMPGAGHGSTLRDQHGNWWHTATMRISVQHSFERRIGMWPAGFDKDGELFCNQRYGDWPIVWENGRIDPWKAPEWFLLSYGKKAMASSCTAGHEPALALDENARTWWQAADSKSGEWLCLDLGKVYPVNAIQINFADDTIDIPTPGLLHTTDTPRFIDNQPLCTQWKLESSVDGISFTMVVDKSDAETDLSHDLVIPENSLSARYLRLTISQVPYQQKPCVSGFRVFGNGDGEKPQVPDFTVTRVSDIAFRAEISASDAMGWNILWGSAPDKLYHSYMTFQPQKTISALIKDEGYWVRVDAFNENGITEGACVKLS